MLWVDSRCFCHLSFQYAIALVSCTHRVVPNNTTPYDFKKKKKFRMAVTTLRNRYLPHLKFSTPHFLPSLSLIGPKPFLPHFA